ncbi:MAG: SDR family oxidoreductase [Ethanoligenens sp.]|uniref:SDR family oxidoreductase n=1 Tax=Ethanoligenens sp. TaxID=2099655 RepID=UPI0039E7EDDE
MYPGYQYIGHETISVNKPVTFEPQHQGVQPGLETLMNPRPISENPEYKGSGKLQDRVVLISGGDSGIGRAVAIACAKEGADVAILYYSEEDDASETKALVENCGRQCLPLRGDIQQDAFCAYAAEETVRHFSKIDVLINNAGVQYPQNSILDITADQLRRTFETNVFAMFYLTKAVLPVLKSGASIINTASITAYAGHQELLDYSATKGAIVSFTRSLSLSLSSLGIRVNAVAPGATWTPLIPASFAPAKIKAFGTNAPMKRAAQPFELAPAYIYLASDDSCFMSGQVLHVNGGIIVGS